MRVFDTSCRFVSRDDLVTFVTGVTYRATVQHSVTNQIMVDLHTFTPNSPPAMMRPPPRAKRGVLGWDEETVRFMLPPPDLVERYVTTLQLLNKEYASAVSPTLSRE